MIVRKGILTHDWIRTSDLRFNKTGALPLSYMCLFLCLRRDLNPRPLAYNVNEDVKGERSTD
jgi:hypothetical protein